LVPSPSVVMDFFVGRPDGSDLSALSKVNSSPTSQQKQNSLRADQTLTSNVTESEPIDDALQQSIDLLQDERPAKRKFPTEAWR
jgi:hypothetical protein